MILKNPGLATSIAVAYAAAVSPEHPRQVAMPELRHHRRVGEGSA
jgi:hypothetical protein